MGIASELTKAQLGGLMLVTVIVIFLLTSFLIGSFSRLMELPYLAAQAKTWLQHPAVGSKGCA